METLFGFSVAGVMLLAALLWNYTKRGSIASASVAVAAFVAGMLFFTGSQQGFEVTPVNLAHLQVDEKPAEPLILGDISIEAFILDDDAPSGLEPIHFGVASASEQGRFYDSSNLGVRLIAQRVGGTPYNGELDLTLTTIVDGRETDITTPVTITDGIGEWEGQPLIGDPDTHYRQNTITVALPASVRSQLASEPLVLTGGTDFDFGIGMPISNESFSGTATLHTYNQFTSGNVTSSELETRGEIIDALETDGRFQKAVRDLCGFAPEDVTDVVIRENDQPRLQASYTGDSGNPWASASQTIPEGQPVWALIPTEGVGKDCILNPPCGNPPPEGQLKVVKVFDHNGDGDRDAGEDFLSGFTFQVGGPESFTFTIDNDPDIFNVPEGTYTIEEINIPDGWILSSGTENPQTVEVVAGQPPAEVLFGNVQLEPTPTPEPTPSPTPTPEPEGRLKIIKWWDEEEDCVFDTDNELFLTDVLIKVDGPVTYEFITVDAPNSREVPAGTYRVEEFLEGSWRPSECNTAIREVTVWPGEITYVMFANVKEKEEQPTPTPTQSPQLIFGCPQWVEHGEDFTPGDPSTFTRLGIVTANRPVTWSVTGADILSSTDESLVLEAFEGAYVVIKAKAKQFNSGWITLQCDPWVPVSEEGATPEPSRTPAPTPPPTGPTPTPQWTPPPVTF